MKKSTPRYFGRFHYHQAELCLPKGPLPPNLASKPGQPRPPAELCNNMQYEPTGVQGVHEA